MGGSILGAKAIYDFLKHKIRKNFYFIDSIYPNKNWSFNNKNVNLIISKSGRGDKIFDYPTKVLGPSTS